MGQSLVGDFEPETLLVLSSGMASLKIHLASKKTAGKRFDGVGI
jgi:hypothetical protein